MKALGVGVLSRGDLLEGMIAGDDPLSFDPLAKRANKRSEGMVGEWVRSWWKDSKREQHWENAPLTEATKDNFFDLHKVEGQRL